MSVNLKCARQRGDLSEYILGLTYLALSRVGLRQRARVPQLDLWVFVWVQQVLGSRPMIRYPRALIVLVRRLGLND